MFGALGLWEGVAALAALAQDDAVSVARPAAGCALRRQETNIRKGINEKCNKRGVGRGVGGGCGRMLKPSRSSPTEAESQESAGFP